ncbi:uncharacterized protein BJ171DRAFT_177043 [Polychytrium aggregatum]|uniref:uncharacterized protein n=1 Tax=Polychytrium aggregatum TaxID=110093 RepID=UPI0022FDEE0E|nr:uncharacterized protein BJ171DRAFT_177043 [Polychytrium aggregatum]KAI9202555.1 hypothetical protein BJ171DRAFT_177043 [Polychytrium aggregatum]
MLRAPSSPSIFLQNKSFSASRLPAGRQFDAGTQSTPVYTLLPHHRSSSPQPPLHVQSSTQTDAMPVPEPVSDSQPDSKRLSPTLKAADLDQLADAPRPSPDKQDRSPRLDLRALESPARQDGGPGYKRSKPESESGLLSRTARLVDPRRELNHTDPDMDDEDAFERADMALEESFRESLIATQVTLQEKQSSLFKVQHELNCIAKSLRKRSKKLSLREAELNDRDKSLEARISQEVARRVEEELQRQQERWKKELDMVLDRCDSSLNMLSKENKRLQNAMKDMVVVNKKLREQLNQVTEEGLAKNARIDKLTAQFKEYRDRSERLKSTLSAKQAVEPVLNTLALRKKEAPVEPKTEQQPKKISAAAKRTASTQTESHILPSMAVCTSQCYIKNNQATAKLKNYTQILLAIICRLSQRPTVEHERVRALIHENRSFVLDTVVSTFIEVCDHKCQLVDQGAILDLSTAYYDIILGICRSDLLSSEQTFQLAQVAYKRYTDLVASDEAQHADTGIDRVLLSLIIASGVQQIDVLESVLDRLLLDLAADQAKLCFLDHDGLGIVAAFLEKNSYGTIGELVSSIVLSLCSEGPYLHKFLEMCGKSNRLLDAVASALGSSKMTVAENLSVLVQKLSKTVLGQEAIANHRALFGLLRDIKKNQVQYQSSGGEFLILNVTSALNFLDT